MMALLEKHLSRHLVTNAKPVLGTATRPALARSKPRPCGHGGRLPRLGDLPVPEMLAAIVRALKPGARLVFVEFRGNDPGGAHQAAAYDDRRAGAQGGGRAPPRMGEDRARPAVAARRRLPQETLSYLPAQNSKSCLPSTHRNEWRATAFIGESTTRRATASAGRSGPPGPGPRRTSARARRAAPDCRPCDARPAAGGTVGLPRQRSPRARTPAVPGMRAAPCYARHVAVAAAPQDPPGLRRQQHVREVPSVARRHRPSSRARR